jgi:hypothetical protein
MAQILLGSDHRPHLREGILERDRTGRKPVVVSVVAMDRWDMGGVPLFGPQFGTLVRSPSWRRIVADFIP